MIKVSLARELKDLFRKYGDTFEFSVGMYVLAMGMAVEESGECKLLATKVSDLTHDPDRFAMWICEILDLSPHRVQP